MCGAEIVAACPIDLQVYTSWGVCQSEPGDLLGRIEVCLVFITHIVNPIDPPESLGKMPHV